MPTARQIARKITPDFKAAWNKADAQSREGSRTEDGLTAALDAYAKSEGIPSIHALFKNLDALNREIRAWKAVVPMASSPAEAIEWSKDRLDLIATQAREYGIEREARIAAEARADAAEAATRHAKAQAASFRPTPGFRR